MAKQPSMKRWPIPQDVIRKDWGGSYDGTTDDKIDDTMAMNEKLMDHNKRITRRQTPEKWG